MAIWQFGTLKFTVEKNRNFSGKGGLWFDSLQHFLALLWRTGPHTGTNSGVRFAILYILAVKDQMHFSNTFKIELNICLKINILKCI